MSVEPWHHNAFSEKGMIVAEDYGQAAHDQIGFLHVRVALRLYDNPVEGKRFAKEALKFLDEYEREDKEHVQSKREYFSQIRKVLEQINAGEAKKLDVNRYIVMLQDITKPIDERVARTREEFRTIF